MVKPRCGDCAFYKRDDKKNGVCRWNPPTLIFLGLNPNNRQPVRISMWPEVEVSAWCGKFQIGPAMEDNDAS